MAHQFSQVTRRNLIVISCCIGVSLALIVLGPVLQFYQKEKLDTEIGMLRARVEVLAKAAAAYRQLQERINGLQTENRVQPVAKSMLAADEADSVLGDLRGLAAEAGVQLAEVSPDLQSMSRDSQSMRIAATCYGTMSGFQALLNALLRVEYVERLEHLRLSAEPAGLQLETVFRVYIQ